MPKYSIKKRFLQLHLSSCIAAILCLIAIIQLFSYGTYNYPQLDLDNLEHELYIDLQQNFPLKKSLPTCDFVNVLHNTETVDSWDIKKKYDDFSVEGLNNGSYVPPNCNPLFSVAILVTYRNRQKQLNIFLPYMHNFLRKQNIHYKIYLIEQQDEKPWNKGMLYNIGAKRAIADKFPCLILHDVDLLPLDAGNLYACTRHPRHMSASIDKFRFVLTYPFLVGGVLAIRAEQYAALNGLSNRFEGWGGEDDDFANRIESNHLKILRFPRALSRYTMLRHAPEKKNAARRRILAENEGRAARDGLGSVRARADVKPHRLFTLLAVRPN